MTYQSYNSDAYPNVLKVGICLKIEELTIDCSTESYHAKIVEVMDWLATEDDIKNFTRNEKDFEPYITVKPVWQNCIKLPKEHRITYSQFRNQEDGKLYNLKRRYLSGVFLEKFCCDKFPFDVENLTFTINTNSGIDFAIFVPSRYKSHLLHINDTVKSFLSTHDWRIVHSVCFCLNFLLLHNSNSV